MFCENLSLIASAENQPLNEGGWFKTNVFNIFEKRVIVINAIYLTYKVVTSSTYIKLIAFENQISFNFPIISLLMNDLIIIFINNISTIVT